MHDISELERRGIPGVFVATVQFEEAAEVQSVGLGFDAARVLTEHPIQDRTDDEMRDIADAAIEALIAALVGPS